jgi:hypothetical protein
MSKRRFTASQITELLENECVAKCSEKSITYSKEFKSLAVKRYDEGMTASEVFAESGFDRFLIGKNVPDDRLCAWRRISKAKGLGDLDIETRGRKKGSVRPKIKNLDDKEKIKRMEIEIAYLKAENDFLAKLRAAKKR